MPCFYSVNFSKDKVKEEEITKIKKLLKKETDYHLQHDLRLAPEWIRKLIGSIKTVKPNE